MMKTRCFVFMLLVGLALFPIDKAGAMQTSYSASPNTAPVSAATKSRIRKITMSHVDNDGEYLKYQDLTALMAKIDKLPDFACSIAIAFDVSDDGLAMIREGSRILMRVLNLRALKATASSSKMIDENCYCQKEYSYMGSDIKKPSILTVCNENIPLNWRNLPADTVLAFCFQANLIPVYRNAMAEFSASSIPEFQNVVKIVDNLKNQGIDIEAILEDTHGPVSGYLAGTSHTDMSFMLEIPDTNGFISRKLQESFPPIPGTNYVGFGPIDGSLPTLDPILVYGNGKVTLYSSNEVRTTVPRKTLGSLAFFRKAALPARGNCYFILKVDQQLIDYGISLAHQNPKLETLLKKYIHPIYFAGVSTTDDNGIQTIAYSNFSIPDFVTSAILITPCAALIPVIGNATREGRCGY